MLVLTEFNSWFLTDIPLVKAFYQLLPLVKGLIGKVITGCPSNFFFEFLFSGFDTNLLQPRSNHVITGWHSQLKKKKKYATNSQASNYS